MKKLLAFLLVFVLSLSSSALAHVDLSALSNQELVDLAHQIIEELAGRQMNSSSFVPRPAAELSYPEITGERAEMIRCAEDKYLDADGNWIFSFSIENTTDTDLFIYSLTFLDNGDPHGEYRDGQNDPFLPGRLMKG